MEGECRPNILIILVDEFRYPVIYESNEMKEFTRNFSAFSELRNEGLKLEKHYVASTACSPSRTSLYTGQYPSLHGVSSTAGAAKGSYDPDMFWLDPQNIPTLGHMFMENGYDTYWVGKWHASEADITTPGTRDALVSYNSDGSPNVEKIDMYLKSNRLEPWGFKYWVGPEPHGPSPLNTGDSAKDASGRDDFYAEQAEKLLMSLCKSDSKKPWLAVVSFVNPHDIALYGFQSRASGKFDFSVDPSVPEKVYDEKLFNLTLNDDLNKKPSAQKSYQEVYKYWFPVIIEANEYYRVYYNLQRKVNIQVQRVLDALKKYKFTNTITVCTSDHGDLLGSHGYMHQKWYNVYEESVHVPFYIRWPGVIKPVSLNILTSHIDMIPTLLGLSGIKSINGQKWTKKFLNFQNLVGRDLSKILLNPEKEYKLKDDPIFFMTDDDVTRGISENDFLGLPPFSVVQPNHIYSVITRLADVKGLWKYNQYFDNPQFWTNPGIEDDVVKNFKVNDLLGEPLVASTRTVKTEPLSPEFELYNLEDDPMELNNLASNHEYKGIMKTLKKILKEECKKKRLTPLIGKVPGQPKCSCP